MKRKILPNKRDDYVPHGIYKLSVEERGKEFKKLLSETDGDSELSERRLKFLQELRGW